jgi:hypothetical protein
MKKYVSQNPQRNKAKEFEFLYSILSPAFIRVRFELISVNEGELPTKIVDYGGNSEVSPMNLDDMIEYVVSPPEAVQLPQHELLEDLCFEFMNNPCYKTGRVILTQNRHKSNFKHPICFEANGAILDSSTWNLIVCPAHAFNAHLNRKSIIDNVKNYTIQEIKDGTIINLYYYDGAWCMSSCNGFDIGDFKWMGDKTYNVIFKEIASLLKFQLENLHKFCSYSVGFRHSDHHPFGPAAPSMWFIKCCNTNDFNQHVSLYTKETSIVPIIDQYNMPFEQSNATELETQKVYSTTDVRDMYNKTNKPIEKDDVSNEELFNMMNTINSQALSNYLGELTPNSIKQSKPAESIEKVQTISPFFGFILRDSNIGNPHSNVILESELFKRIRQFIYNLPKNNKLFELKSRGINLNNSNRLEYAILKCYLDYKNRVLFQRLFPQFHERYTQYDVLINKIIERIIKCFKNNKTKNTVSQQATSTTPQQLLSSINIDKLSLAFYEYINKNEKIDTHNIDAKSIINDYICSSKFIDIYFSVLYSPQT